MLILETPRLLLRHLTLDDLPAVATLYSDPIVMAPKGGIRSPELTEQIVKGYLQEYTTIGYCFWAVVHRQHNTLIGLCGLLDQQDVDGQAEVEIAYTFAKEYWNQGLATEATQACKEYGFQVLGRTRLVSLIAPSNIPSQRVALKNGMVYERDFVDKRGRTRRIYAAHLA
ncbi:MAG TPA: GNAT family N-acetyltransferase [Ktedonobacter sp.]|jgi:ribosomal-protein-alanine N-acetyltransferase|nr:GNAT family N-acetyltransferase [Ktedonobacter sp.]HCF87050.1 GNAT family N-acetyltransferase [Ktedonobacter sp.]HCP74643.1 GNAT family N-acetyltransferase [Ktedonobacter sp.]